VVKIIVHLKLVVQLKIHF